MLIDTSGFFAVFSEADNKHILASEIYQKSRMRLTTNYILAEYVALAIIRGLPQKDVALFSEEILFDETIEIIWVDVNLHLKAVQLIQARQDKTYSLCDAASFVLMKERGINESLTTDIHFEQEGFIRLLK
jgi:predicted nucleic acid-binding protein